MTKSRSNPWDKLAAADKPRDHVVAEWIVAEFEGDSVHDVVCACARVIATLSAADACGTGDALLIARAACADIETLTKRLTGVHGQ